MTVVYHTAITTGAAANAAIINAPLAQLDAAIVDILNGCTFSGAITGTSATFSGNVGAATYTGDGSALTGIASGTGGVTNTGSTTIGADTDANGVGEVVLQVGGVTYFTLENDGQVKIVKGWTGVKNANDYQLLIQNTGENADGPNDYQNEVHLRLQAGTSANHRRYIDFFNYDDSQEWLMGVNASGAFIVYNTTRLSHFIWAETDGNTYINSDGNKAVRINYHPTDTVGGDGLGVYDGVAGAGAHYYFGVGPSVSGAGIDSQINMLLNAGATGAQTLTLQFQDRGTTKWQLIKGATNGFSIYDSANSKYAIACDASMRVGVHQPSPIGTLHVMQAATDGGMAALVIEQQDVDREFLRLIGDAANDTTTNDLVATADAAGTLVGYAKIYVQDDGNQITDGYYYVPFYSLAAP